MDQVVAWFNGVIGVRDSIIVISASRHVGYSLDLIMSDKKCCVRRTT